MTNAYWFKPKRIGYGATPSTWEGWAVTAAYCLVLSACVSIIVAHRGSGSTVVALVAVIIAATVAMIAVGKKKTDGAWGWNAGAKQNSGKND